MSLILSCVALALAAHPALSQNTEKPLLSEEIGKILEKEGAQAAQKRFDEIFPAQKEKWDVDVQAMLALGNEYAMKGDMEAGQTIMNMVTAISQETQASYGVEGPEAPSPSEPRSKDEGEAAVANQSESGGRRGPDLGPARDDLERFTGEYGADDGANPPRRLFVTISCEGHLVSGAMWGDASNWWLKTLSDTEFEYSDQWQSVKMSFETGPDGKATTMIHDLDYLPSPLPRVGPLQEGWEKCVVPPWG